MLGVVLAVLAVGISYSQGVNSLGTLCAIGAACFVMPLLWKKMREQTIVLPVREGDGYDLEQQKALICEAIRTNKTLTWEGKPFLRPGEISILPNIRIGRMRERENQVVIHFRLWTGDDRWPHQRAIDGYNYFPNKKVYILTCQGAQVQGTDNPSPDVWLDPCVKGAVSKGHPVLITGISSSDVNQGGSLGTIETRSYQWEYARHFDAGIILIRYLKHLTGLSVDLVRKYAEKQLGCVYADDLIYPTMAFPVPLRTLLQ